MEDQIKKVPLPETSTEIVDQPFQNVKEFDIDQFLQKRTEFITKVNKIMVEGKDYYLIQGKKSLAKGGAEKIASIFGWVAKFVKDEDTYVMLKQEIKGAFVVYMCYLVKPLGLGTTHTIGQGRGASILSKNAGDPNKTIKMAQKSAYIDAVIRASGLSDFFTQDLEDMVNRIVTPTVKPVTRPVVLSNSQKDNFVSISKMISDSKNIKELESVIGVIQLTKLTKPETERLRTLYGNRRDILNPKIPTKEEKEIELIGDSLVE